MRAWLRTVADGPCALVLSGEPGIGKTVLWQVGVAEAGALGHRVLAHRSVQAEASLAFAGLSELAAPLLDDVADQLAPPRRRALEVALLLAEPEGAPPDPRAIGLAFRDLLSILAEDGPVTVALDDVQWLDASSAAAVAIAVRRLRDQPVGILATLRSAPGVRAPFELDRILREDRMRDAPIRPLGPRELHRLLVDRVGLELAKPDLMQVLEISGGNPFFALELARETARRQAGRMRVPESLRELLGGRFTRLPAQTREVLLSVAAAARPTAQLVAAACGGAGAGLDALEVAAAEGVVHLDDSLIRFAHPLLASVCYEQAPAWKRQDVHRRLASAVDDVEQRARHLALAADGADGAVAAELEAAAGHAAARGAMAAAAELGELAADRTPADCAEDERRRRRMAADFLHFAGDFVRATAMYEALVADTPPGPERADALYAIATLGSEDVPTRVHRAEQGVAEAAGDDARSARILGFIGIARWVMGDLPAGLRDARAALAIAERHGDPSVLAIAIARVGLLETWALDITPGLLERGMEIESSLPEPLLFIDSPAFMMTQRLYETDELDRSRAMLEAMLSGCVERGDEHTRQWVVLQLVIVEYLAGRLHRALEHGRLAREIAEQTHEAQYGGMALSAVAGLEADLGLLEQARRSADDGLRRSRSVSDEVFTIRNLAARGRVELVSGDLHAAGDLVRDLPERQLRTGQRSSLGTHCWIDAMEVLIGLGELASVHEHLARFREIAAVSNRCARAGLARCEGLLAAAEGDRQGALCAFERALAADDVPLYPLERARTLLAMGAVLRQCRQRRAARRTLGEAVALFDEIGARPWAEKARAELARISGRRASPDDLTDAERRVAELAARGRHNKEIAAALYIGVGTVESHLSHVYRKLGVRSRTELAGRFARPMDPATPD